MMQALTLNEFKLFAKKSERVAIFKEIALDTLTSLTIYSRLNKMYQSEGVIFENMHPQEDAPRSFICFDTIASLKINEDEPNHPFTILRDFQSKLSFATRSDVSSLITSSIGFITYDAIRFFEAIPDRHPKDALLPIFLFNFYRLSFTINHKNQTLLISIIVEPGNQIEQAYHKGQEEIRTIIHTLLENNIEDEGTAPIDQKISPTVDVDISDFNFTQMIHKAKNYIIQGDAFQIVLSRCYKRSYSVSPLEIYNSLRQISPAPFMFYFPTEFNVIIGASPERLIQVKDQLMTVNPIAGTRKKTLDHKDEAITTDLLTNQKELSEHLMLVDLARNDVGAVSIPGTVEVSELLQVKHYSHVSHISSTVNAKLKEKFHVFDALASVFPAGTLSGAPKIRAMEIIDELETSRRGLYGGTICRLDSLGHLDSCIAIRMAILQDGIAKIRTGAGIVYDSDPTAETQETYQKAESLLEAIAKAHGENHVAGYR